MSLSAQDIAKASEEAGRYLEALPDDVTADEWAELAVHWQTERSELEVKAETARLIMASCVDRVVPEHAKSITRDGWTYTRTRTIPYNDAILRREHPEIAMALDDAATAAYVPKWGKREIDAYLDTMDPSEAMAIRDRISTGTGEVRLSMRRAPRKEAVQ